VCPDCIVIAGQPQINLASTRGKKGHLKSSTSTVARPPWSFGWASCLSVPESIQTSKPERTVLVGRRDRRQWMVRDLALWQGASEERYPQRSLTERATPPESQRSDRNVASLAAQTVTPFDHPFSKSEHQKPTSFRDFNNLTQSFTAYHNLSQRKILFKSALRTSARNRTQFDSHFVLSICLPELSSDSAGLDENLVFVKSAGFRRSNSMFLLGKSNSGQKPQLEPFENTIRHNCNTVKTERSTTNITKQQPGRPRISMNDPKSVLTWKSALRGGCEICGRRTDLIDIRAAFPKLLIQKER
jgi:hypothetical protein